MIRYALDGVLHYRFESLDRVDGLFHAVLTRIGGVSRAPYATLNLGHTVGDDPEAVEENHRRALEPLDLRVAEVVSPWQVHGASVDIVSGQDLGTVRPKTDALLTRSAGVPLMMRFADCSPVFVCEPTNGVVGLIHAGWRGIVAHVVQETICAMTKQLGCHAQDIQAGIGPTIGPCCYQVGAEVAEEIAAACPQEAEVIQRVDGRIHADLPAAVEAQLRRGGVERIEQSRLCTSCRVDEFFSHRAENGSTGRFGTVIGWRDG